MSKDARFLLAALLALASYLAGAAASVTSRPLALALSAEPTVLGVGAR